MTAAKGGVGKTSIAINVGAKLADKGNEVVIVDGDLAMPDLSMRLGVEVDRGIHSVLAGEASVTDALVEVWDGLWVLPGDEDLEAYANADVGELSRIIDELAAEFDVVLLDTASGLSRGKRILVEESDGVVFLSEPSESTATEAETTSELVDRAGSDLVGGLLTRARDADRINDVLAELDVELLGIVPEDSGTRGDEPVVFTHQDSELAEAYRTLADSLEQVLFDGDDPEDLATVYVEGWFDDTVHLRDADDEDESGSFGMFG